MSRVKGLALLSCTLALVSLLIPSLLTPTTATRPTRVANVLVFSNAPQSPLITSLGIDREAINMTVFTASTMTSITPSGLNSTLHATDVIFIDRYLPTDVSYMTMIASHVNGTIKDAGLVVFGFFPEDVGLESIPLLSPVLPVSLDANLSTHISTSDTGDPGYKVQVGLATPVPAGSTSITSHIGWTSCPAVSRRFIVDAKPGASTVVVASDIGFEGDSILAEWNATANGSHVMFYSMILELNKPFYLWPYFNYLMYVSVFHAITGYPEGAIESYADWPYAPIPNSFQEFLWFLLVGTMAATTIIITVHFKRRGDSEKRLDKQGEQP